MLLSECMCGALWREASTIGEEYRVWNSSDEVEKRRERSKSRRFFVADNPTDCELRMWIDYVEYEGIFNRKGRIIASFWRLSDLETILVILNLDPCVEILQPSLL